MVFDTFRQILFPLFCIILLTNQPDDQIKKLSVLLLKVCTLCLRTVMSCVSAQHPVLLLPDCAAECVRTLPVWRRQHHPVSGFGLMVRHRD